MPKAQKKTRLEAARAKMYRDLVFDCAEHIFAERGFDDATMQDMASEAGISLKTLYATYPGKNEIYRDIQEVRGREFLGSVGEAIAAGDTALAKLSLGARAYVEFLLAHRSFLRIHLRERVAWGLGPSDEDSAAEWRAGLEQFTEIVRQGMREGVFYDGDPVLMAMMSIAILQVQLSRLVESPEDTDPEEASQEIVLHLRRMLCLPEHGTDATRRVA